MYMEQMLRVFPKEYQNKLRIQTALEEPMMKLKEKKESKALGSIQE